MKALLVFIPIFIFPVLAWALFIKIMEAQERKRNRILWAEVRRWSK